ncbi:isomerase [Candidatus Bathyarchaeota archaeon B24-2]|nr:MAG: isomerase [Candidatus Bathyarchaeota archaeon B24-2]
MKIVDVKASFLKIPLPEPGLRTFKHVRKAWEFTIVKVFTDEGITGIGGQSGWLGAWGPCWAEYVNTAIKSLLLEEIVEPFYIEKFAKIIRCQPPSAVSPRPSCVEMALWDIVGKAAGQPVYKLLGAYQDKVKAYASSWGWYPRRKPEEWAKFATECLEEGFKAIKIYCSPQVPPIEADIENVKAIRDAVGDEMDIMVDAESAWSIRPYGFQTALKLAKGLEKYDVFWLEEPLPHLHNPELSARLAAAVDIPIAGGGQVFGLHNFKTLLERNALDIVQPDVGNAGGILEVKKIALLAETYGKSCAPHTYGPGLLLAESLQLAGSINNIPYLEYAYFPPVFSVEVRDSILKDPIRIDRDGYIHVPKGPGLGVELDEERVAKYTVQEKTFSH